LTVLLDQQRAAAIMPATRRSSRVATSAAADAEAAVPAQDVSKKIPTAKRSAPKKKNPTTSSSNKTAPAIPKRKGQSVPPATPPPKKGRTGLKKGGTTTATTPVRAGVVSAGSTPSAAPSVPTVAAAAGIIAGPSTPSAKAVTSTIPVVSPNQKVLFASAGASSVSTKAVGKSHPVDQDIAVVGKHAGAYHVVECSDMDGLWYDAVLNQCNIAGNNNKYYRLQILKDNGGGSFYVWCRWGRVGEPARAASSMWMGPFSSEQQAKGAFSKKYRDKTGNAFAADTFIEKSGKYVPVEVDNDVQVADDHLASAPASVKEEIVYLKSALDPKTKELVEVLFSKEMRNEALTSFNLDLKRLPLGVPSMAQIQLGVTILTEIEDKLKDPTSSVSTCENLSSRFYTAIPHSFGRTRPPIIASMEALQSRYDMCNILLDMFETTATISRIEVETTATAKKLLPNPVDQFYNSLKAELVLVESTSHESDLVRQYFDKTKAPGLKCRLLNIWSVDRKGEAERFQAYDNVGNRHLLWHGTNIAVAAPIITSGLRIMPHSGGRVGAGIYLASLNEKSAQYTSGYGNKFACMFLCEAPLGKQYIVNKDGSHASNLRKAPSGFDSVHAVGAMQPKIWAPTKIDGKDVLVPVSQAEKAGVDSNFHHDEFLVYEEAQVRMRYVVTVDLG
jgi:poly [ADP-ribose] polymerase 2/3/4